MRLAACSIVALLLLGAAREARGQEPSPPESARRHWYSCLPGDKDFDEADKRPDSPQCEVRTKELDDRKHPDSAIAVALGYGLRLGLARTPDRRLADALPLTHWYVGMMFDYARGSHVAAAVDLEYMLEGQSSPELYGGEVSTAITMHSAMIGTIVRQVLGNSDFPAFAMYGRIAPGFTWAEVGWRDAASRTRSRMHDHKFIVRPAVGLTWRTAGLSVESGAILALHDFSFGPEGGDALRFPITSWYGRVTLSIRLP